MEELNMELSIESSLPPGELKDMMERLDHPLFCVTYDIGNSASMGYDTTEEIDAFGAWIRNVHVKDRLLGGTTVALGTGNADFESTFAALKRINYAGSFTLQAVRDGDPIENTKRQLVFLHSYIASL
jgi:hexulose-6-phosphate isomerase